MHTMQHKDIFISSGNDKHRPAPLWHFCGPGEWAL